MATENEVRMHWNSIPTKFCRKCRQDKPFSEFYSFPASSPGRRLCAHCKDCMNTKRRGTQASKEQRRRSREANPEREQEQQKRYRAANPEKISALRQQARALRRGALGEHTAEELAQMHLDQSGLCAYCEIELDGVYHVEHMIPLVRGGTNDWSNIALSCPRCNRRKHDKTVIEYMEHLITRT